MCYELHFQSVPHVVIVAAMCVSFLIRTLSVFMKKSLSCVIYFVMKYEQILLVLSEEKDICCLIYFPVVF